LSAKINVTQLHFQLHEPFDDLSGPANVIDTFANSGEMYLARFFARDWLEFAAPNRLLPLRVSKAIGMFFD
jgi:hypothetical protein